MTTPAQNQGTGSANVVGNPQNPPGFSNQPAKKFPLILALIAVVFLVIFFVLAIYYKDKLPITEAPAAKVGSERISKAQVEQLASDCAISQEEAVYYLVDEKVLTKWATDEKVVVSEKEASDEAVRIGGLNPKDCKKTMAQVNLLRQELSNDLTNSKEGRFIIVNFGLYANPRPITAPPGVKNEEDRVKKLQEDRTYADNLVNAIYKDIKDKKITFEQGIEQTRGDSKTGDKSVYATTFQSGEYTSADYKNKAGLLNDEFIRQKIDGLSQNEISEPFVQKIDVAFCAGEPGCQAVLVDSRWVILKVERVGKGVQGTLESLLTEMRKKFRAQVY